MAKEAMMISAYELSSIMALSQKLTGFKDTVFYWFKVDSTAWLSAMGNNASSNDWTKISALVSVAVWRPSFPRITKDSTAFSKSGMSLRALPIAKNGSESASANCCFSALVFAIWYSTPNVSARSLALPRLSEVRRINLKWCCCKICVKIVVFFRGYDQNLPKCRLGRLQWCVFLFRVGRYDIS